MLKRTACLAHCTRPTCPSPGPPPPCKGRELRAYAQLYRRHTYTYTYTRARTHIRCIDESAYAYVLNVSGAERRIKRREREERERVGTWLDVATCLRHLIGNHGALPRLGRECRSISWRGLFAYFLFPRSDPLPPPLVVFTSSRETELSILCDVSTFGRPNLPLSSLSLSLSSRLLPPCDSSFPEFFAQYTNERNTIEKYNFHVPRA